MSPRGFRTFISFRSVSLLFFLFFFFCFVFFSHCFVFLFCVLGFFCYFNFLTVFFSFLVHALSVVRLSSVVVNFSHFRLLLWNHWAEFNETWQEARSQRPLPSCVFRTDRKNKMSSLVSDWQRHFRLLLWNRWTEFNKTWQEASFQHPLYLIKELSILIIELSNSNRELSYSIKELSNTTYPIRELFNWIIELCN